MSSATVLSLGIGLAFRAFINTYCGPQNDKTAGVLLGVWDGIVAYRAWRSTELLEPTTLVELIFCVCFDVLFHGSVLRTVCLILGAVLGVLMADALPVLWDDLDIPVLTVQAMRIINDFDSSVALSEFSDDVTLVYEEYSTTEWITGQRKAPKAKSRQRSAVDIDKRISRTKSWIRKAEAAIPPLPVPPPLSIINIDVQPPSSASRISSPTIKAEKSITRSESPHLRESIMSASRAATPQARYTPISPSLAEFRTKQDFYIGGSEAITSSGALPSLPFTPRDKRHLRKARASSSAHVTEQLTGSYVENVGDRVEIPRAPAITERSEHHTSISLGNAHTTSLHPLKSPRIASRPISPIREVVIDYSDEMTKIIIPPAAEARPLIKITSHISEEPLQPSEDNDHPEDLPREPSEDVDVLELDPIVKSLPRSHSFPFEVYAVDEPSSDARYRVPVEHTFRSRRSSVTGWQNQPWNHVLAPSTPSIGSGEQKVSPEHESHRYTFGDREAVSEYKDTGFRMSSIIGTSLELETPPRSVPESAKSSHSRRGRSVTPRHSRKNTLELDVQEDVIVIAPSAANLSNHPHSPVGSWHATLNARDRSASRVDIEHPREGPSPIHPDQQFHVEQSLISSPLIEESVLSDGPKASIFLRAQEYRKQAYDVEARCKALHAMRREAQSQGRRAEAFVLSFEIEDAETLAKQLHRKAERRFYMGRFHF
ncbi:hypothetical protein EW145_g5849 [Phellinidium pouzarii]|uniref:DUF4203 domain-containing protein n=1 Tax=Phellinidium pouzarii TaxID=167371 RepID=A0A4S4KYK7_9AGAM|nr:hypothetical protein EW145_g5849 [Phellinidium pouzarii]